MKYEMIFGNKIYFEHQENEYVVAIQIDHDDESFEIQFDTNYPSKLNKNETIVAMRRIIKEPKRWTWEDKKAGRLPDVGSKCLWCNSKDEREVIAVTCRYVAIECDNDHMKPYGVTHEEFIQYYNPIETPTEKAQRLEDEHLNMVAKHHPEFDIPTARAIYRLYLSGELQAPKGE